MAIQIRGSNNNAITAISSNIDVSGIGIVNGDFVFLHVYTSNNVSTITPPSGFELLANLTSTNNSFVYFKRANSEPADYTVTVNTGNIALGVVVLYSDIAGYVLEVANTNTRSNNTSTTYTWNGVSASTPYFLLCFGVFPSDINPIPQVGMTKIYPSVNRRVFAMYENNVAIVSSGNRTATGTSATSKTITFAIEETDVEERITQHGMFSEVQGAISQVTQHGMFVELSIEFIHVTQHGMFLEFEPINEPDLNKIALCDNYDCEGCDTDCQVIAKLYVENDLYYVTISYDQGETWINTQVSALTPNTNIDAGTIICDTNLYVLIPSMEYDDRASLYVYINNNWEYLDTTYFNVTSGYHGYAINGKLYFIDKDNLFIYDGAFELLAHPNGTYSYLHVANEQVIGIVPSIGSYFYMTTDGGYSWKTITLPNFVGNLKSLFIKNLNEWFVLTDDGNYIYYTVNRGKKWFRTKFNYTLNDIKFYSKSVGYIAGGKLLRTYDGGKTWVEQPDSEPLHSQEIDVELDRVLVCKTDPNLVVAWSVASDKQFIGKI